MKKEEGLRVVETSATVGEVPAHDAFALAVAFDEAKRFVMIRSAKEGRAWELPGGKVEEVRVFGALPDELTRITFDRETFEVLVAEARRTVNEDS